VFEHLIAGRFQNASKVAFRGPLRSNFQHDVLLTNLIVITTGAAVAEETGAAASVHLS